MRKYYYGESEYTLAFRDGRRVTENFLSISPRCSSRTQQQTWRDVELCLNTPCRQSNRTQIQEVLLMISICSSTQLSKLAVYQNEGVEADLKHNLANEKIWGELLQPTETILIEIQKELTSP